MAAPKGTMSDSESSSSSSDVARCREAAMPAWGLEQRPHGAVKPRAGAANNRLSTSQPSLSFITISEVAKEPTKAQVQKVASKDDGFRLFFMSVPGGREKEESPQPRRKRPPSSSSEDKDEEWRRCREAAVSASDILQKSAIHGAGTVEKEAKKKRKWKKKAKKVAVVTTTAPSTATVQKQKSGELTRDQVSLVTKKKKKGKKASEASPFPLAKSATAAPAN
ncbi:protein CUSTOS-like isoform X2 [Aotus nancymaae]|uniref:protein CUSTOS-like isoform X2 n=1 Tax=Aotus nancymaae TaxID=37293 RepID=UPI0030FF0E51